MSSTGQDPHNLIDDEGSRLGMWIFLFTEIFLFGGLFLIYAVFRHKYSADFHSAAIELNTFIGTLNTVVLLVSSMTAAMSITAVQKNEISKALKLIAVTIICALIFGLNKYFEWSHKFSLHMWPGSDVLKDPDNFTKGEYLFFTLYYMMTGLHAIHVIIGVVLLSISAYKIKKGIITPTKYVFLENTGLYWHLVDLIWIFLFPLLYLIT